ncbi:hypothetical protein SAMN05421770_1059 [Granulicella rosea]|uniref:Uncharacterized protein n=1 Tax=Granulicella rosea TaxID=474952 RepID=A0A239KLB2_9BACT|nr:hypothetical protein [Granulicella rosea]SNT18379.1 hypothetical protein SAMN05421770_1059 [Granulicella rosea]
MTISKRGLLSTSSSTLIALSLATSMAVAQTASPLRFDERWWNQAIHDAEREGFVAGYLDCLQSAHLGASYADYIQYVSANVSDQPDSVPKTIQSATREMKSKAVLKGGENWSGPHGFLDGDYWGTGPVNHWLDSQNAFVEGYLACRQPPVTKRAVDRYTAAINRHYANPKLHRDKIANVLEEIIAHSEKAEPKP